MLVGRSRCTAKSAADGGCGTISPLDLSSPSRCPGIGLAYETQHRFRRDRGAHARASDIINLAPIVAIPYVDFLVTDAAMMTYCRQAVAEVGMSYPQLVGNLRAVMTAPGSRLDRPRRRSATANLRGIFGIGF